MIKSLKKMIIALVVVCGSSSLQSMEYHHKKYEPIKLYENSLPKIETVQSSSLAEQIVDFLCLFNNFGKPSQLSGIEKLIEKVNAFITQNVPLEFILMGFTAKSSNTESKVLTLQFDLADFLSLFTLHYICTEIKTMYKPGALVTIFTQEMHSSEINDIVEQYLGVPLFNIADYQQTLTSVIEAYFKDTLKLGLIENIQKLYDECPPTDQLDEKEIRGLTKFMEHELQSTTFLSRANEIRGYTSASGYVSITACAMAQAFYRGNRKMRSILEQYVPHYAQYIRLSVRASDDGDVSKKLGLNLIYKESGTSLHTLAVMTSDHLIKLSTREKLHALCNNSKDVFKKAVEIRKDTKTDLLYVYLNLSELSGTIPPLNASYRSQKVKKSTVKKKFEPCTNTCDEHAELIEYFDMLNLNK